MKPATISGAVIISSIFAGTAMQVVAMPITRTAERVGSAEPTVWPRSSTLADVALDKDHVDKVIASKDINQTSLETRTKPPGLASLLDLNSSYNSLLADDLGSSVLTGTDVSHGMSSSPARPEAGRSGTNLIHDQSFSLRQSTGKKRSGSDVQSLSSAHKRRGHDRTAGSKPQGNAEHDSDALGQLSQTRQSSVKKGGPSHHAPEVVPKVKDDRGKSKLVLEGENKSTKPRAVAKPAQDASAEQTHAGPPAVNPSQSGSSAQTQWLNELEQDRDFWHRNLWKHMI